ncbi:hypothetical protein CBL_04078 [Carabus blaptoides fortunei]
MENKYILLEISHLPMPVAQEDIPLNGNGNDTRSRNYRSKVSTIDQCPKGRELENRRAEPNQVDRTISPSCAPWSGVVPLYRLDIVPPAYNFTSAPCCSSGIQFRSCRKGSVQSSDTSYSHYHRLPRLQSPSSNWSVEEALKPTEDEAVVSVFLVLSIIFNAYLDFSPISCCTIQRQEK